MPRVGSNVGTQERFALRNVEHHRVPGGSGNGFGIAPHTFAASPTPGVARRRWRAGAYDSSSSNDARQPGRRGSNRAARPLRCARECPPYCRSTPRPERRSSRQASSRRTSLRAGSTSPPSPRVATPRIVLQAVEDVLHRVKTSGLRQNPHRGGARRSSTRARAVPRFVSDDVPVTNR